MVFRNRRKHRAGSVTMLLSVATFRFSRFGVDLDDGIQRRSERQAQGVYARRLGAPCHRGHPRTPHLQYPANPRHVVHSLVEENQVHHRMRFVVILGHCREGEREAVGKHQFSWYCSLRRRALLCDERKGLPRNNRPRS